MDKVFERHLLEMARHILAAWHLPDPELRLIAYRENAVFAVYALGQRSALRLHRPGYMSEAAVRSELDWLRALTSVGVPVPLPMPTSDGNYLVSLEENGGSRHASMLTWVDGIALGRSNAPLHWGQRDLAKIFHAIGSGMANLHRESDAWARPQGFQRHAWDAEGLLGEMPLWGRFWDGARLDRHQSNQLRSLRDRIAEHMTAMKGLDYGLIHADIVRENVLVDGSTVQFIDFDDAGFGWRLFDLATALLPNLDEPNAPMICRQLLEGYRSRRPLADLDLLPMFLVLRALTYVGWFSSRPEVDPTGSRLARHIERALRLAERWQAGWSPAGACK